MNIGVAKVFQTGVKQRKWLMVAFVQLRLSSFFCKLKGKLPGMLFRLVWQEPHSAIPWLRH